MGCICDIPEMVICIKNTFPRMRYCPCCMTKLPETCTDEEGNILICKGRASVNTANMGVDLDKINIDREIFIMEQNLGHTEPWMIECVKQSQKQQIIEYLKEKGEKNG